MSYQESVLRLETLQAEYDDIMRGYEQAQANYITALKNSRRDFTSIQDRTYNSDNKLWSGVFSTVNQCKKKCKDDKNCTGATYNSSSQFCETYSGEGEILTGNMNTYALVLKVTQSLLILQQFNTRLIDKSSEIDQALQSAIPYVNETVGEKDDQQKILQRRVASLQKDRDEINAAIGEFDTMDQENLDREIVVNQRNSTYMVVFLFTVLLITITFKQILYPESDSNLIRFIFWFVLLSIFIINVFQMNTIQGFFIVFLLVLVIILILMNIIPSP
jgi:hypothetical protein